ncbi:MAG: hypothetical protein QOK37_2200 [Thermoanaerobaculia bacterium]|jgi:hypothetical protein|nr:hypothetical protein [Thermoanaerobaculia bacterium]
MKSLLLAIAALVTFSAAAATDATYSALRSARPDGRTIALHNFTFDRDVYHVTLDGTLHLLAPVAGATVGAVFTGHGTYELTPASEAERHSLAINTSDSTLKTFRDDFEAMTIFDAALINGLMKSASATGVPDATATRAFDKFLHFEQKELKSNIHIRVLQSLLNGETTPLFLAVPDGKRFSRVALIVDGRGYLDGEETALVSADDQRGGVWYSSHLRGEKAHPVVMPAHASHYMVESSLPGHDEIRGTTTIDGTVTNASVRVLPVELDPRLRIAEATVSDAKGTSGTSLGFIQENEKEDGNAAIVFPAALKQGETFTIRIRYSGFNVLKDAGDGNYYVQARTNWYPNLGTFTQLATYDLTYHYPKSLQLVSVGEQVEDKTVGDTRTTSFRMTEPARVAGFNFGTFRKISKTDKSSGLTVDVYTNPGTPNIIKEINQALQSGRGDSGMLPGGLVTSGEPDMEGGPHQVYLDTASLADSAMADAVNASRVASAYFGASQLKKVSISQQSQWDFGQSWPGLVYLPYLAVLSGTTRAQLGLAGASDFIEQVGPHEMSHQWWGHTVGPATYHDTWLSEGFADFSAALVLQFTGGPRKYNEFWESSRKYILTKQPRTFITNREAGPISQGPRLSTWRNPYAYQALVYNKGAYVLHMLRMTMQDRTNRQNPDADFIAMMTDFVRTYSGRNATTEDFRSIVQKHMTPNLDAMGNGKPDWFFDQWIYGTEIPRYTAKFDIKTGSDGKFHITGSIVQDDVGEGFRAQVPIYAEFDKGQIFKIAQIPMIGTTTRNLDFEIKMPKKPNRLAINLMHDVLAQ